MRSKGGRLLTLLITVTILFTSCSPGQAQDPSPTPATSQATTTKPVPLPSASATKTFQPTLPPEPTASPTPTQSPTPSLTPEPCALATEGFLAGVNPREQRIVWWHHYSTEKDLYAIVFDFNYTNDCEIYVDLKYQGSYATIHDKMVTAFKRGDPPDLVVGYQNDQAFYQRENRLADINPYIEDTTWGLSASEQADFYPSFWNQSVHPAYSNQRLGFALNRSMEVLFYNTTWAMELGFNDPPVTPEEFEEQACAAAAAKGDGTGGLILRNNASAVAAWTFAFGGNVLDESGTRYVYNSQATIEAISMLKRMHDHRCAFSDTGYASRAFAARRALFTQGSSSGLPFYLDDVTKAGTGDQFIMIPIPHITVNPRQNVYGGDILIPQTTPERQLAAWIFVKWFTSPRVQSLWVKVSSYYPTRQSTSALLESYSQKNPVWASGYKLLPFAIYEPQLISYDPVRELVSRTFDQIMRNNGANIKELLDSLTDKANQLQKD